MFFLYLCAINTYQGMNTLKTFFFMLSLFCWVDVKAQVGVTTQESLWTTKKDAKTGNLQFTQQKGKCSQIILTALNN